MGLKIFTVERTDTVSYDEYDSFVVIAKDEEDATSFNPNGERIADMRYVNRDWPLTGLKVTQVGVAFMESEPGVILASYNAG